MRVTCWLAGGGCFDGIGVGARGGGVGEGEWGAWDCGLWFCSVASAVLVEPELVALRALPELVVTHTVTHAHTHTLT